MQKNPEQGSTMVLVLVFAAISMAALTAMNTNILQQTDRLRSSSFKLEYDEYLGQLNTALNDPQACFAALGGLRLAHRRNVGVNDPRLNAQNITVVNPLGDGDLRRGVFPVPNDRSFRVTDVSLQLGARDIDVGAWTPNTYYRTFDAKLIVSAMECNSRNQNCANMTSGNFISNRVRPNPGGGLVTKQFHQIDLKVYVDQNNRVQGCFGRTSVGTSCLATGGVWNPTEPNPRFRCMPYRQCRTLPTNGGGSMRRAASIAGATCQNPRYTPIVMGQNFNTGQVMYICEWCNDNTYNTRFYSGR